jgi:hypothetical protein
MNYASGYAKSKRLLPDCAPLPLDLTIAAGISSSRVHQLLKEVDATEIPEWLSQEFHRRWISEMYLE